jgi:hypothetical protein
LGQKIFDNQQEWSQGWKLFDVFLNDPWYHSKESQRGILRVFRPIANVKADVNWDAASFVKKFHNGHLVISEWSSFSGSQLLWHAK